MHDFDTSFFRNENVSEENFQGNSIVKEGPAVFKTPCGTTECSESGINYPEYPLLHSWDTDVQRTFKGTTFRSAGTSLAAGPGRGSGVEKIGQQEGSRISIKNI